MSLSHQAAFATAWPQVHCDAVEEALTKQGVSLTSVPETVVVNLNQAKARAIINLAAFLDHVKPWPEDLDNPPQFSLKGCSCQAMASKPAASRVRMAERSISERLIACMKVNKDEGVQGVIELAQGLQSHIGQADLSEKLSDEDRKIFGDFQDEIVIVAQSFMAIAGQVSPGTVESAVVKKMQSRAKTKTSSMSAVVTAAMSTSTLWQARPAASTFSWT